MHVTVLTNLHNKYEKSLNLNFLEYHSQSSARFVTTSCWKLSRALTAVTSFWQLWQLLQRLQLLHPVNSFDSWNKLLTALTAEIGCRQLCQLESAVDSRSFNKFQDIEETLVSFGLATACVSEWWQDNARTSVIGSTRSSISAKILGQECLVPNIVLGYQRCVELSSSAESTLKCLRITKTEKLRKWAVLGHSIIK